MSSAEPPASPPPPLVSRAVDTPARPRALVFIDPRGAFASVKANPLAMLSLTVMLGFSALPPLAFLATNDVVAVAKHELKRSGKLDSLTPVQREKLESATGSIARVALPLGAVTKRGLWIGLIAVLCFALMRGTRVGLSYWPVLGAVCTAMAPLAVHDVVSALTYLVKDINGLDVQNVVLSNPAAWLKWETGHSPLAVLLRGLDFFDLWACLLAGIGVNVVAGTRSSLPYVVAFGAHVVIIGLQAIAAAAT